MASPLVGLIMGSRSDWETMRHAAETLDELEVPFEQRVVSAHRTPDLLFEYAASAEERGLKVLIAGAGGAAHLPGHGGVEDDAAGARRAGRVEGAVRDRLAALDRPDARRRPGRRRSRSGGPGAVNAALLAAAILARVGRGDRRAAPRASAPRRRRRCSTAPIRPPDAVTASGRVTLVGVHRRRPARAHARARRAPARALVPLPRPVARRVRAARWASSSSRDYDDADGARRGSRAGRTSSRTSSRTSRSRPRRASAPCRASRRSSTGRIASARRSSSARSGSRRARFGTLEDTGLPALVKTRRLGYDGKGSGGSRASSRSPTTSSPRSSSRSTASSRSSACAAETARRGSGRWARTSTATGSSASRAPRPRDAPQREAEAICAALLDELGYVGVLAVELFEVGGRLLANEFAPRVHNTGHWTIDGAETSQFENHLRAILGLPLGATEARRRRA